MGVKPHVPVSVRVGEETGLKDGVGRGLDTGHKVGWRERGLLDLSEVVVGVLVESDLADGAKRELRVRPDLGQVQDVVPELLGLLGGHGLLQPVISVSSLRHHQH